MRGRAANVPSAHFPSHPAMLCSPGQYHKVRADLIGRKTVKSCTMAGMINLNADMGEGFGAYTIGNDDAILKIIRSASIACGFHAGDPITMRRVVRRAKEEGVSI